MVPPGWKTVSSAFTNLPTSLSDSEWSVAVDSFCSRLKITQHASLVKDGVISINPCIIFDDNNKLSSAHCAYIRYSQKKADFKNVISILISHGVRCFSVFVGCTKLDIFECVDMLNECSSSAGARCQFTLWCELHSEDTFKFFSVDGSKEDWQQNKKKEMLAGATFSIGILVPHLFFQYMSTGDKWVLHGRATSERLNVLHGPSYNEAYAAAKGIKQVSVRDILALITHAAVASRHKYIIHARDGSFYMRPTEEGAQCVWSNSVNSTAFANHLGEVPMLCEEGVVLQFSAFVNAERVARKQSNMPVACNAAYDTLAAIVKSLIDDMSAWREQLSFVPVSMSTAVGVIGLAESLGRDDVVLEDIESTILPLHRSSHTIFPLRGAIAAALWCVSPGCWTSYVPFSLVANDKGVTPIPSGGFARYLLRQRSSLQTITQEEIHKFGCNYALIQATKRLENALETPLERQIHDLRKVCASFFSPCSMRLLLTHQDGSRFHSISSLVVFLSHVVVSNWKNNCCVLLPEIYSCDVEHAIAVDANRKTSSIVRSVASSLLPTKRKHNERVSDAVSGFLQGLLYGVRRARSQAPLPSFAIKLLRLLSMLKEESM